MNNISNQEIKKGYDSILSELEADIQKLFKLSAILSILRLIIFVATLVLIIWASSIYSILAIFTGIIGLSIFLFVIKLHHSKDRQRQILSFKQEIIRNELSAIQELKNYNYDGAKFIDQEHNFSSDLDVFGPFSLYALVNRCRTYDGIQCLADNMRYVSDLEELRSRTEVIKELESDEEWRLNYLSSLYEIENGETHNTAVLVDNILNTDLSFSNGKYLSAYRKALPLIWMIAASLYFYNTGIALMLVIIVGLINFRITMLNATKVSEIQFKLSTAGKYLERYADALAQIYNREWTSHIITEYFKNRKDDTSEDFMIKALVSLKKISDLLDYRLHMIPSFILNIGFLWDSLICTRLANWYNENEAHIKVIFSLIGNVECFTSLANWSFNHPHFSYPKIDLEYFHFEGHSLRHPLMKHTECVPNDFSINRGEYVSILTGSNMSGKSTFLRTIGLNIILGNLGVRAAASSMSYSLVHLITYMRIKDALEENVSTFKSELNRVVKILELLSQKIPVLILADEMLRGTNSHDKLNGSKAIVRKIVQHHSYSVVATHDLALAQLGNEFDEIHNYFFDIDYQDGNLVFDYKIKEGICQNFNASFLLSQLGLDVDFE